MGNSNIESKVESLIEPIIHKLNYEVYDVQYIKEGKDYYLRITIDSSGGITIEDCEKVNCAIDEVLDHADYIKESYFLEVSSPGLERNLRKSWHFEKQIGNEIQVKLFKAVNQKKEWRGILKAFNETDLELEIDGEKQVIERKDIALAKTVCDVV